MTIMGQKNKAKQLSLITYYQTINLKFYIAKFFKSFK